jgi:long-chain acyl-CoA synthetase
MPDRQTVYELFRETVSRYSDRPAYTSKKDGRWVSLTWADQGRAVQNVGKALMASGVAHGEIVGILSGTRLEWLQADFGINSIGATTLGIYPSSTAEEVGFLLSFSGATHLFVETEELLRKVESVREKAPRLRTVVLFDGGSDPAHGVVALAEFLGRAGTVTDAQFDARAAAVTPEDVAALVATSGTTGVPKLAMITHDNLVFTTSSVVQSVAFGPDDSTLLFLPLAHVFARVIAYSSVRAGCLLAFAESLLTVGENLKEIRPTFIASVPRIFEKIYEKILAGVNEAGGIKVALFGWAVGVGLAAGEYRAKRQPVPGLLAIRLRIADKLVLHKIRAALGGRLVFAISGAAPLNPKLGEFFHASGVLVLEGLGMTENTSFSNVNRLENYRFGTVGQPGPGIEMKIAADGEIVFHGRNVMKGYYNNPEATAESIGADGWLRTGDVGEIDPDGHLRVTDRKKDLIITSGGKNVAPQRIERILRESPYIAQAICFGDRRKYLTALVTLEPSNIAAWAKKNGIAETDPVVLAARPEVRQLVEREVGELNGQLASYEKIKKFELLPRDLTIEAGELTPSLKIKRKVVFEKYGQLVEKLYADAAVGKEQGVR